ncbi:hypothetical protein [Nocardia sp. NPDC005366]|uniref:hypothetical protein n=1 Tax=Nocardia sp. NPDC005366 TaxID=3156878 RepID=UPI0033BEEB4A
MRGASYRGFVGVFGELFPGKKLTDESSQSGDGEQHRPRVELDLDAGVIRVSGKAADRDDEGSD